MCLVTFLKCLGLVWAGVLQVNGLFVLICTTPTVFEQRTLLRSEMPAGNHLLSNRSHLTSSLYVFPRLHHCIALYYSIINSCQVRGGWSVAVQTPQMNSDKFQGYFYRLGSYWREFASLISYQEELSLWSTAADVPQGCLKCWSSFPHCHIINLFTEDCWVRAEFHCTLVCQECVRVVNCALSVLQEGIKEFSMASLVIGRQPISGNTSHLSTTWAA